MAIVILGLFLVSYTLFSEIDERKNVQKRVETMNSFLFSLETDVERQMFISGFRAILSIQNHITSTGTFINNSETTIKELLQNGTINSEPEALMEGFTIPEWNDRASSLGDKINVNINFTTLNVSIKETTPWTVTLEAEARILMEDKSGLASWDTTKLIISEIDIEDFEDPLYLINTNGLVPNKIKISPYENDFIQGSNVSNLLDHTLNSYYIASTDAPSFLDRLEGKTSPNNNGIESLINLEKISDQGITIQQKSVVDHIYFSAQNPPSSTVAGMPAWFRIDDAHKDIYQIP